jgi:hypothetical protein
MSRLTIAHDCPRCGRSFPAPEWSAKSVAEHAGHYLTHRVWCLVRGVTPSI